MTAFAVLLIIGTSQNSSMPPAGVLTTDGHQVLELAVGGKLSVYSSKGKFLWDTIDANAEDFLRFQGNYYVNEIKNFRDGSFRTVLYRLINKHDLRVVPGQQNNMVWLYPLGEPFTGYFLEETIASRSRKLLKLNDGRLNVVVSSQQQILRNNDSAWVSDKVYDLRGGRTITLPPAVGKGYLCQNSGLVLFVNSKNNLYTYNVATKLLNKVKVSGLPVNGIPMSRGFLTVEFSRKTLQRKVQFITGKTVIYTKSFADVSGCFPIESLNHAFALVVTVGNSHVGTMSIYKFSAKMSAPRLVCLAKNLYWSKIVIIGKRVFYRTKKGLAWKFIHRSR